MIMSKTSDLSAERVIKLEAAVAILRSLAVTRATRAVLDITATNVSADMLDNDFEMLAACKKDLLDLSENQFVPLDFDLVTALDGVVYLLMT